ncbi:sensor domain-containing diguanylate cyclase [Mangrovitalea sediminis]|uniref:sensor domain-containing diguanylate cyclase n=1 Tax=Mangrovitalea sediminis TaxID=1982043 RepID=UPI000BE4B16F|nr:diguanylate cyclase [Mangrovitalea sediminis]
MATRTWAAIPVVDVKDSASLNLGDRAGFLLDKTHSWTASQLIPQLNRQPWTFRKTAVPNFGLISDNLWVAFRLHNALDHSQERLLELGYPMLDKVDVYFLRDGQLLQAYHTGDRRPFDSRPIDHRSFLFPLRLKADETLTVLMRVETEGALQLPLKLWKVQPFFMADATVFALQVTFTGIMLALAIYNLMLFFSLRQITFLWYVCNVVFVSLALLTIKGLSFQYLWPNVPWLNNQGLPAIIDLDAMFVCLFAHSFLGVRRTSPFISKALRAVAGIALLLALSSTWIHYNTSIKLSILIVSLGAPVLLGVGIYLWIKGEPLAKFFTLAWGALLIGHTVLALDKTGVLPSNDLFEYAPQFGAVIEVLLLSFALGYRINLERKRRYAAQADALRIQSEANSQLESKVRERTFELEQVNRKLRELSALDGLTQVKNRLWFDEAIANEWRRSCRDVAEMSLMILDVDHFKQINDTYGHQCGDACLQHLAALVSELARRAGDDVARYGGEEFVIMLPQTSLQGAAELAEMIRYAVSRQPLAWDGKDISMTLSIGVAGCVPAPGHSFEGLIRKADEALYAAKAGGRNQVVVANLETSTQVLRPV